MYLSSNLLVIDAVTVFTLLSHFFYVFRRLGSGHYTTYAWHEGKNLNPCFWISICLSLPSLYPYFMIDWSSSCLHCLLSGPAFFHIPVLVDWSWFFLHCSLLTLNGPFSLCLLTLSALSFLVINLYHQAKYSNGLC